MIAKFWDVLFDYGEEAKQKHGADSEQFKTYETICDMLQAAWDSGEKFKELDFDNRPKTSEEAVLLEIAGLSTFEDPQDGTYFYEMDGRHFDTPSEVIQALLDDRNYAYSRMRTAMIRKVKKWFTMKAESIYSGKPCVTLEEYIEVKKREDKGKKKKKTT